MTFYNFIVYARAILGHVFRQDAVTVTATRRSQTDDHYLVSIKQQKGATGSFNIFTFNESIN